MKNKLGCFFVFALSGYSVGLIVFELQPFAGIIGAVCGFLLAKGIDRFLFKPNYSKKINVRVLEAITKLSLLVMKADECITTSQLYAFRDYMLQHFGSNATADAIEMMKNLKYKKISSSKAASVVNAKLNYPEKTQVLQFLFQLAAADGEMQASEYTILNKIADDLHILPTDFIYLKNAYNYMYNRRYSQQNSSSSVRRTIPEENDYAVLGMKSTDSNEDIKAAYRRLAMANHPDKVQYLGETAHHEAEKQFSRINEAYNRIRKERKI